jgi:DNA mismatch repair protein MutH
MAFRYEDATKDEILARARLLENRKLGDLGFEFSALEGTRGRHEVGHAIESFFGIPRNSRRDADFPSAHIELKVVPLRKRARGLTTKERTVLSMIDFDGIVLETWETATVRKKLNILFVFFQDLEGRPKSEFPIKKVLLWQPDSEVAALLKSDWERVRTKIRQGLAHELSESDGRIMGPCTKGVDSRHLRRQPFSDAKARSRAFALKQAFTKKLYMPPMNEEQLLETTQAANLEDELLSRFSQYVGRTVGSVGDELGVPLSSAKSYAAGVVRRAFGASNARAHIKEFDETGLTLRITRVNDELFPYEAISFRAFDYFQLLEESWEDSALLSHVEYMLLVPLQAPKRTTPQSESVFGRPLFWRPTSSDLTTIAREWELYRLEIRDGKANHLTPASETTAIHVRPHGRNREDTSPAPGEPHARKQSFWLNQPYIQSILKSAPA